MRVLGVPERDFENQIAALYREPVALPDEREFIASLGARVDARVDRRRWLLAGAGAVGAGISCYGIMRADALSWLRPVSTGAIKVLSELSTTSISLGVCTVMIALLLPVLLRYLLDLPEA